MFACKGLRALVRNVRMGAQAVYPLLKACHRPRVDATFSAVLLADTVGRSK